MDEAMLHLLDGPPQEIVERTGRSKVEACKLAPEGNKIEGWRDGAFGDALVGAMQCPRQKIVPTLAVFARRKQNRDAPGLVARILQVRRAAAALSSA